MNTAIGVQRVFAIVMAAAFGGFIIIPFALKAHDVALAAAAGTLLIAYAAVNVWLLARTRTRRS